MLRYSGDRVHEGLFRLDCLALVDEHGVVTTTVDGMQPGESLDAHLPPSWRRARGGRHHAGESLPAAAEGRGGHADRERAARGDSASCSVLDATDRLAEAQWEAAEEALPPLAVGLLFVAAMALLLDRWLRAPASGSSARRTRSPRATRARDRDCGARANSIAWARRWTAWPQRAHRELEASRSRLETALQALPAAAFMTDRATGNVLFVSARWARRR